MIKTAPIFTSEMVLQRDKMIAIWGEADLGAVLQITLGDNMVTAKSDKEGKWQAKLPSMKAGGPYQLKVVCGEEKILLDNVMIGDVWLAGGQSNMELELQNSKNGKEVAEKAENSQVRYFTVPHVGFFGEEMDKADAKNSWHACTPQTAGACSAVGYYFAKEIAEKTGVAIGIISCNWGGTSASCWMDEETIVEKMATKVYMDEYNQAIEGKTIEEYWKEKEEYDVYYEEWNKKVTYYYETHEDPSWDEVCAYAGENKWPGPVGPGNEYRPTGLYHAMLQRVCPYTLKGFLYYQGEQDESKPDSYYSLLCSLVEKWRKDWEDDCLPFLCVQLPMFKNKGDTDHKNWPVIREAQMRLFQTVKNTGIAVILDAGEFNNIHPLDKETVGHRLALQAMVQVYGMKADAFGPLYRSYETCGNAIWLTFDYGEDMVYRKDTAPGLEPDQSETGFEIAGEEKEFVPAKIQIEGEKVMVFAEEIKEPKYVRYAWTNYGPVTMFGKNGIPMAPFRTSVKDDREDS